MEGISMNTLQMDPYWNQYWQQSMLMNSMYQGGASSQIGAPQTGTGATNPSFQANPNGASATTNIQSMQEEPPKKGKGWKIAGIATAIGATALLFFANSKGGGNIAEGLKKIWGGVKGKADDIFTKTKTINNVNVAKQGNKINRLEDVKALEAIGGKGTLDLSSANTAVQKYTCVVDDVTLTIRKGNITNAVGKDGKVITEISDELRTKVGDLIKKVDAKDADTLAKLTNLEYVHTADGIRSIFKASNSTQTPVFQYGTSKWFPATT